ncbi:MAG: hypothetical protein ABS75_05075 [Pelagibacterium sp. SCN 63-23]|nr:MAG: hypothetical protein ABS75_05075 [Pelagibacterium sp. SCN 63-23]
MGQCLRGKMAEMGLVPPAPVPAVADASEPTEIAPAAEPAEAEEAEEAVPAEPALDVTPPAGNDGKVDAVIAATFGLLRAEPDGSVVIAGSGLPGSEVQVFANGELLGSVKVEASGDWVFVPDEKLPPGGLEITLGEAGKDGTAEDSFIVVINEDRTSQPLVVASTPGRASEVLQGLTAAAPPAHVASAQPVEPASPAPAAEVPAVETAAVEAPVAETPAAPAAEAEAPPQAGAEMAPEPVAPAPEAVTDEPAPAPEPTVEAPAQETPAVETPAVETPAVEAPAAPAEASQVDVADVPATVPAQAPAAQADAPLAPAVEQPETTAPAPAEPAAQPVQSVAVAPTIDAIEIEGERTFFAGAGPENGIIRLYVDDAFVADAIVADGRWLVEAGPVLGKPSQRVRIDLLQAGSAQVVARAEVDFVVDVPATEAPVVIADAPAAPSPEPAQTAPAPAVEPAPAQPAAPPPAEAAEPAPAEPAPAAESETAAAVAPAAEVAPGAAAPASEPATTPAPAPATPETPAAPAEQPAPATAPTTPPAPAVETPAVPRMVAVSLGDPEAQRFASGKAIIRRGDNLWTIARRVYGEGLKYTTIYQANNGQIRDPDRIYPGQVFDLPQDGAGE